MNAAQFHWRRQFTAAGCGPIDHLERGRGALFAQGAMARSLEKYPWLPIAGVKSQAQHLRVEMARRISDRIQTAGGAHALFQALLYGAPAGARR